MGIISACKWCVAWLGVLYGRQRTGLQFKRKHDGKGHAYSEILSDGYRTVTRYLCVNCEIDYGSQHR